MSGMFFLRHTVDNCPQPCQLKCKVYQHEVTNYHCLVYNIQHLRLILMFSILFWSLSIHNCNTFTYVQHYNCSTYLLLCTVINTDKWQCLGTVVFTIWNSKYYIYRVLTAVTLTPALSGVEALNSVNAASRMLVTRLRTTNDSSMSILGLSSDIRWPSLRWLSLFCIVCPTDGVLACVRSCNCCCCTLSFDLL